MITDSEIVKVCLYFITISCFIMAIVLYILDNVDKWAWI